MLKVYCAGAYSADDVLKVMSNMRKGIETAIEVALLGHDPYCPWLDFQYGMFADIPLEIYQRISMRWLESSHAILLVPGWENSKGTAKEIQLAHVIKIPVFTSLTTLHQRVLDLLPKTDIIRLWDDQRVRRIMFAGEPYGKIIEG